MDSVTPLSAGALLYLVIFGAIIAYTCYFWLLLHTRTVVAISYEYVNPVIGVFLGWLLAGEQVDGVIVTACCLTPPHMFKEESIPTVPDPSTPTRSSAICAGSGWTGTRARTPEDRQDRTSRAPAWSCTRTP